MGWAVRFAHPVVAGALIAVASRRTPQRDRRCGRSSSGTIRSRVRGTFPFRSLGCGQRVTALLTQVVLPRNRLDYRSHLITVRTVPFGHVRLVRHRGLPGEKSPRGSVATTTALGVPPVLSWRPRPRYSEAFPPSARRFVVVVISLGGARGRGAHVPDPRSSDSSRGEIGSLSGPFRRVPLPSSRTRSPSIAAGAGPITYPVLPIGFCSRACVSVVWGYQAMDSCSLRSSVDCCSRRITTNANRPD